MGRPADKRKEADAAEGQEESWKEFFNTGTNWKDFPNVNTYEDYKKVTDKQHLSKAQRIEALKSHLNSLKKPLLQKQNFLCLTLQATQ